MQVLRDHILEPPVMTARQEYANELFAELEEVQSALIANRGKVEELEDIADEIQRELEEMGYCI